MDYNKELHTALIAQNKSMLSEDFLYSTDGYKAALIIAVDLGLRPINEETMFDFLDRIFELAKIIGEINDLLLHKVTLN